MAGLVPATHPSAASKLHGFAPDLSMGGRHKAGHDAVKVDAPTLANPPSPP